MDGWMDGLDSPMNFFAQDGLPAVNETTKVGEH